MSWRTFCAAMAAAGCIVTTMLSVVWPNHIPWLVANYAMVGVSTWMIGENCINAELNHEGWELRA